MYATLIEALRDALTEHRAVRLAILFGSIARGKANDESDVDLAVVAPAIDHLGLARDVSLAVGREVQIVDLEQVGYALLCCIVRDGIVVAEHEHGAAARWRTRSLLTLETDRRWFERMRDAYLEHLATGRSP